MSSYRIYLFLGSRWFPISLAVWFSTVIGLTTSSIWAGVLSFVLMISIMVATVFSLYIRGVVDAEIEKFKKENRPPREPRIWEGDYG